RDSTPCFWAHSSRAGATSATQTVAPSSRSTRRCFSPQRPRPTRRTFIARSLVAEVAAQALGDFVTEQARLHPADRQQVGEGDERAVPHPVLRPSEAPGTVVHRHLDHAVAPEREKRRDEPVEPPVEHEVAQALATERPERAPAVLDRLVAEPVAHAVGDARGDAAAPVVAVGARLPPTRRGVPPVEVPEELRDIRGVVLEVRVHHDDPSAERRLEPGVGRRGLPRVRLQPHPPPTKTPPTTRPTPSSTPRSSSHSSGRSSSSW